MQFCDSSADKNSFYSESGGRVCIKCVWGESSHSNLKHIDKSNLRMRFPLFLIMWSRRTH